MAGQGEIRADEGDHGRAAGSAMEVARLALKLGLTAFGGPAAHVAMLHDEIVTRRKWMSDAYFLDLLAATNLIPGPNSTEMVIHAGRHRAGWRGLFVAGALFILPAALMTMAFAWIYAGYGTTPQLESFLSGVKPVVIAVIVQAIWGLGRSISDQLPLLGVAVIAFVLVGATHSLVPKLRSSPWSAGFLDGVSAAAVGMMASVTVVLGRAALVGPFTVALALLAALLLIRFRINSAWLIASGGMLGLAAGAAGL